MEYMRGAEEMTLAKQNLSKKKKIEIKNHLLKGNPGKKKSSHARWGLKSLGYHTRPHTHFLNYCCPVTGKCGFQHWPPSTQCQVLCVMHPPKIRGSQLSSSTFQLRQLPFDTMCSLFLSYSSFQCGVLPLFLWNLVFGYLKDPCVLRFSCHNFLFLITSRKEVFLPQILAFSDSQHAMGLNR